MKEILILLTSLIAGSCATQQYSYLPTGVAGHTQDQDRPGKAYYDVPPGAPNGNVRIVSGGVVRLRPEQGGGEKIAALHVEMVISNQTSAAPWTVDPQAQTVTFPDAGAATAPIYYQSISKFSPNLVVSQGEIQALHLYFKLPGARRSEDEITGFDFHWQVQTGPRPVKETTSFDRVPRRYYGSAYSPYYPDGIGVGLGFGLGWGYGYGWGPPIAVQPAPVPPPSIPVIVGH